MEATQRGPVDWKLDDFERNSRRDLPAYLSAGQSLAMNGNSATPALPEFSASSSAATKQASGRTGRQAKRKTAKPGCGKGRKF
jgi:hypothetical protein